MLRRFVLVSFIAGVLIAAELHGISPRALAQQAILFEAPKWDLGDRWTWQLGKDEITLTVLGTSGGYAVQQKAGSEVGTYHFALDFSSKDFHYLPVQFPLTVGKEWMYTLEGKYSGRPATWNIKRKVEGMDSITVPAGTFDAVRISGHHCNITSGGYCGDFVAWYAPKTKQVAKVTWTSSDYWPQIRRGLSQLLVSYELRNP